MQRCFFYRYEDRRKYIILLMYSSNEYRLLRRQFRIRTGLIKLYHLPTADATLELRQRAVTFFVKRVYIHPIRNKAELSLIIHEQDCIAVLSIKQCNSPETIYDLAIFE